MNEQEKDILNILPQAKLKAKPEPEPEL